MRRRELLSGIALLGSGAALAKPRGETAKPAALPADLSDWESVRRQFPLDYRYVQMSQFFLASHPQPVRAAIEAHRRARRESLPLRRGEHRAPGARHARRGGRAPRLQARRSGDDRQHHHGPRHLFATPAGWAASSPNICSFDRMWREGPQLPPAAAMTPGGFHSFEHRWALAEAFRFHTPASARRASPSASTSSTSSAGAGSRS
jgi:hypothetical protein